MVNDLVFSLKNGCFNIPLFEDTQKTNQKTEPIYQK